VCSYIKGKHYSNELILCYSCLVTDVVSVPCLMQLQTQVRLFCRICVGLKATNRLFRPPLRKKCLGRLKLGHGRFLSHHYSFIIHRTILKQRAGYLICNLSTCIHISVCRFRRMLGHLKICHGHFLFYNY
jgi:uncharacterized membrane protein